MSDEQQSKRERQKARRDAKRVQEQAQAKRSRRSRLLVYGAVGLLLLGVVGAGIASVVAGRQEASRVAAAAQENLGSAGCTEPEDRPDEGAGHFNNTQLAASPPEVVYQDRPATSGQHFQSWTISGTYDQQIDERVLVHNLEHGYVVAYYAEGAPEEQVQALKDAAEGFIDGDLQKVIVAPWQGELPEGANFTYTAWNVRQSCEQYDPDIYEAFVRANHSTDQAPEAFQVPHLTAEQGIDPEGEPLLLPPLDQSTPGEAPTMPGPTEGAAPTESGS